MDTVWVDCRRETRSHALHANARASSCRMRSVRADDYYDSEQDIEDYGVHVMSNRLQAEPTSRLRRLERDVHASEAARRAARHELERRERLGRQSPEDQEAQELS